MQAAQVLQPEIADVRMEQMKLLVVRKGGTGKAGVCFQLWENGVPGNLHRQTSEHAVLGIQSIVPVGLV